MGRWDKMAEQTRATIQAEVPEPCMAVGGLQPAGTWGSFGITKLSPPAGMFRQHQANRDAGALSARHGMKANHVTYIALTADKVYAFDTRVKGRGIKVVDKLAEWDRGDVTVRTVPGRMATKVLIDHVDGGHYELEATTLGGFNDAFLATLAELSPH